MDYIESLFNNNFLEYASYVIRDRAIPDVEDGLKPVQRRILHTLFEMDDGRMHKVASVVGECMKIHPHGDQSIASALVVLANKEIFIEKQGNFGNILTGDSAAASRYIECRIRPFAKKILLNPAITNYVPSYDGRKKEPVTFRAKLPLVLIMGAEGIAVGMSTKILPHNIKEVIEAEKACLSGKPFQLYPDFPTGGEMDVSGYEDGMGKVIVRAKLDLSDPKKIVIKEIPFGCTSESVLASIENAAKSGRIKISEGGINDYTKDKANIEIKLQRGVYAQDVVDALYAFTECEQSVSCNLLVIKDNMPSLMTVSEVIKDSAKRLVKILKDELEDEKEGLFDRLHMRTLERIFIEERIYKKIETMKTAEGVIKAVLKGFEPYKDELIRPVTEDDVDRLLKIPIRRISLYDINKNRQEVEDIKNRIKEINKLLKNLTAYAISVLDDILEMLPDEITSRKTKIARFSKVDVKEAVSRDMPLRYDDNTGYLGTSVSSGRELMKVSPYDRIIVMRRNGVYTVTDVPDKLFVDKGLWYAGFSEKEVLSKVLFTVVYRDTNTGYPYIKRCRVEGYILNRDYLIVPDSAEVLYVGTKPKFSFTVHYEPKARVKKDFQVFKAQDYAEKGLKTLGVRLAVRKAVSVTPGDLSEDTVKSPSVQAEKKSKVEAGKKVSRESSGKTAVKTAPKSEVKTEVKKNSVAASSGKGLRAAASKIKEADRKKSKVK